MKYAFYCSVVGRDGKTLTPTIARVRKNEVDRACHQRVNIRHKFIASNDLKLYLTSVPEVLNFLGWANFNPTIARVREKVK